MVRLWHVNYVVGATPDLPRPGSNLVPGRVESCARPGRILAVSIVVLSTLFFARSASELWLLLTEII